MPVKFNPFTGQLQIDEKGSGGGSSYIDGEVATYNDLPLDGTAALNSAWLVREASGIWPVSRKQAGIYIRTATAGSSRDADYTYAGTMPDVFSDSVFLLYDEASTTRTGQFNLGSITAGQNRVLTWPDGNGTIARTEDFAAPPAIGSTTRNTGAFTTLNANNGTITASAPVLDLSQTWNASGVTFTGLTFNVTNTASAATSRVFNFLIGGTSRMAMNPSGDVLIGTGLTLRGDGLVNSGLAVICGTNVGINNNDLRMRSTLPIQWSSTSSMDGTADLFLRRDAAGALAQYNGTNAQESRLYGTFTSSTNYQRMTIKSVRQTLSALSGASATTTGTFIPDGAVVVGVTTRVATLLTGATGYTIGDGTDADRWGDINATAVGTTSDNANWTAGTIECFTAGGEVTLTANGSNFTAGAIEICVFYLAGQAD